MYKGINKVYVKGQGELELFTIGHTAKLLKRSVETIRAWERQKIIPRPMYLKGKNVRLYHPKEVEAMKKALRKLKKNAKKQEIQVVMWACIREARMEIINGQTQNENSTDVRSPRTSNQVQSAEEQGS